MRNEINAISHFLKISKQKKKVPFWMGAKIFEKWKQNNLFVIASLVFSIFEEVFEKNALYETQSELSIFLFQNFFSLLVWVLFVTHSVTKIAVIKNETETKSSIVCVYKIEIFLLDFCTNICDAHTPTTMYTLGRRCAFEWTDSMWLKQPHTIRFDRESTYRFDS